MAHHSNLRREGLHIISPLFWELLLFQLLPRQMRICIFRQCCSETLRRYALAQSIGLCFNFHLQLQCTFKLCVANCNTCEANLFNVSSFHWLSNFGWSFVQVYCRLSFNCRCRIIISLFDSPTQFTIWLKCWNVMRLGPNFMERTATDRACCWIRCKRIRVRIAFDSQSFSKSGTFGISIGNVRRDAMKTFKHIARLSKPLIICSPFKTTRGIVTEQEFLIITPSVISNKIFCNFHRKFISMFGKGICKFWDSSKHNDPSWLVILC